MKTPSNFFQCDHCNKLYSINSLIFRCSNCDGLLKVTHTPSIFKHHSTSEWLKIFQKRKQQYRYPFISGVWDYKEWVLNDISEKHIVSLGEGRTPLLEAPELEKKLDIESLYIKQSGISHSGSFKDIGMTVLVSYVNHLIHNDNHTIKAIVCASSGDTSAALAAYAARARIPAIVLLPIDRITRAQLMQPLTNGALVIALKTDFDGCMSIIKKLTTSDQNSYYLANSMNPLRIEGQKTILIESIIQILSSNQQMTLPDWIVVPSGNLGNLRAQADGLKTCQKNGLIKKSNIRLLAAQSGQANPFYLSYLNQFRNYKAIVAKKTVASAIQIGNPISIKRAISAIQETDGVVEQADEHEIFASAKLSDQCGFFTDPQTAVALACAHKARQKNIIKKHEKVLILSTAHALKFVNFKEQQTQIDQQLNTNTNHTNIKYLEANFSTVENAINVYLDHYPQSL